MSERVWPMSRLGLWFVIVLCAVIGPLILVCTTLVFLSPMVSSDEVRRVLGGFGVTAILMFFGMLAVSMLFSSDRRLFATTPMSPRQYFTQQFTRLRLVYASMLVVGPAMLAVFLPIAINAEPSAMFHWSPILVAGAFLAFYVSVFAPVTLVLLLIRIEHSRITTREQKRARQKKMQPYVFALLALFWVALYYRSEIRAFGMDAIQALIESGPGGFFAIGILSPISAVAVEGLTEANRPQLPVLLALWSIVFLVELIVVVSRIRQPSPKPHRPSVSAASSEFHGGVVRSQEVFRALFERLVDPPRSDDGLSHYREGGLPEERFVHQLRFLSLSPWGRGVYFAWLVIWFRFPALICVGATALLLQIVKNTETMRYGFALYALGLACISSLYGTLRWTFPLGTSNSLPIRMGQVTREIWRKRLLYNLVVDAGVATFFVQDTGIKSALYVFVSLQLLRVCGQIRAIFSFQYSAGRKCGSLVYELPIPAVPVSFMIAAALWDPAGNWTMQMYLFAMLFCVAAWTGYGFLLLHWLTRDNDTCVPRNSTSYRGGAANQPV